MFGWFKTQFDKVSSPELDWIQVEVTTYCNSDCIYCPHTTMGSRWRKMHRTLELFRELIPFIRYTKLIYLQGWGEPLLNPEFFEMLTGLFDPVAEVIAEFKKTQAEPIQANQETIFSMLQRRPCTSNQIADTFGMHLNEVSKYLGTLTRTKQIRTERKDGEVYYAGLTHKT